MLLIRGAYLWTGSELLRDAAAVCQADEIIALGPYEELRTHYPAAEEVGQANSFVLPGLVNGHHHGNGITAFAGGSRDTCLECWLPSRPANPPVDPYLDSLWAATGLIMAGFTSVAFFGATRRPETAFEEAHQRIKAFRDAGLRVAFGLDVKQRYFYVYGPDPEGLPPKQGLSAQQYIDTLDRLRQAWAHDNQVAIFAAPSGPHWLTDETWEAVGAWSREHQLPLHTHALETPYEFQLNAREYGGSQVAYLDARGALHSQTTLVHGVYLTDAELGLMARRGVKLVTNPASNLRLRSGVAPVLKALAKGVTVALGTDGMGLGDRDNALAELQLLLNLHRPPGINNPALTYQQAFAAATAHAAQVTPWGDRLGSLAVGKAADFTLLNYDSVQEPWVHPDLDPLEVVAHRAAAPRDLEAVVVAGKIVYRQGLTLVDRLELKGRLVEHLNSLKLPEPPAAVEKAIAFFKEWPV